MSTSATSAFSVYRKKRLGRSKNRRRVQRPDGRNFTPRNMPSTSNAPDGWESPGDSDVNGFDGQEEQFNGRLKTIVGNKQVVRRGFVSDSAAAPIKMEKESFKSTPAGRTRGKNQSMLGKSKVMRKQESVLNMQRKKQKAMLAKRKYQEGINYLSPAGDGQDEELIQESEDNISADEGQEAEDPHGDVSVQDSIREGEATLRWMLFPLDLSRFFEDSWEQRTVHLQREKFPNYFSDLLSIEMINAVLNERKLVYSKNIDITHYSNGKRATLNPPGVATSKEVWDFYNEGCSIRLLNPQAYFPAITSLLAMLQEYFGSYVGANVYLTPPNSQGFAPHYDDIEAFVLQVDGQKTWKLYKPRPGQELPRDSSKDFRREEISKQPTMVVKLCPGELLYMPRGWIHEASTEAGKRSLHITVSCYQHQAWIDLFEKLMPAALETASEDKEFRCGLPLGYLHTMGVANSDLITTSRKRFLSKFYSLSKRLVEMFQVDAGVDQIGRQFMHDALPPVLGQDERILSIFGEKLKGTANGMIVVGRTLTKNMKIKLLRASVLRLVVEDESRDVVKVYHCGKNSLTYHEFDERLIEVATEEAYMVEYLIHAYPQYVVISQLPTEKISITQKVDLATRLFNEGILLVST